MPNLTQSQSTESQLVAYMKSIFAVLAQALESNKITHVQLVAVLVQLKNLHTKEELKSKINQLSSTYPILNDIIFTDQSNQKSELDNQSQVILANLIKEGKITEANQLNTELAAANNSPETIQTILNKYNKF